MEEQSMRDERRWLTDMVLISLATGLTIGCIIGFLILWAYGQTI